MIPGLKAIPGLFGGGGGGISLSFLAAAVSSGNTISIPGAALAGDWAILFDAGLASSSAPSEVPSGWTSIVDTVGLTVFGAALRQTVSHRKLTAAGGSVTGMSNLSQMRKIMLVFRPTTSIVSSVPSAWNAQFTTGDPAPQTVTASGVATPLIVFAFASTSNGSVPSFTVETPAMTNVTRAGTSYSSRVGYTIYNSSPLGQSIDMGTNGSGQGLQSGYVRFT